MRSMFLYISMIETLIVQNQKWINWIFYSNKVSGKHSLKVCKCQFMDLILVIVLFKRNFRVFYSICRLCAKMEIASVKAH